MSNIDCVKQIQKTFRSRKTFSYDWRISQIKALKRFMDERISEIRTAMWADLHKGGFETEVTETGIVLGEIDYALKHLKSWMKPERVATNLLNMLGRSQIRHDPYGTVLIIGAWNYPLNLLLAPLVGAIAGGNTAVIKPSELAPATSALLAKFIPQYMDPESIIVVEGGVPETGELLGFPFDYIFFTGSGPVGKIVMKAAAENLVPITLELGGKSPAIVMEDADIKVAARRIAWGKFMNAGQTCIAPDYVLIHPQVEDEFLRELKHSIEVFYGKDASQSPDYCRIVNDKNFQRLEKFIGDGEIFCGGKKSAQDKYIEPTVLAKVSAEAPVMKEEIFGPILPVLSCLDISTAITFINARPKPLALYLFTENSESRERVLDETSSGNVLINDVVMHMPSPYIPFGGVGASGMGRYHGKRSFSTFTHAKGIITKSTWPDLTIRYAPYIASKLKWIKRLS